MTAIGVHKSSSFLCFDPASSYDHSGAVQMAVIRVAQSRLPQTAANSTELRVVDGAFGNSRSIMEAQLPDQPPSSVVSKFDSFTIPLLEASEIADDEMAETPSYPGSRECRDVTFVYFIVTSGCLLCAYMVFLIVRSQMDIHPNECDRAQAIGEEYVSLSSTFLENSLNNLLAMRNVTTSIQSNIALYRTGLTDLFESAAKNVFPDCSQASRWTSCIALERYVANALSPAYCLVAQCVNAVVVLAKITISPQEKDKFISSQVNFLCDNYHSVSGCPVDMCWILEHDGRFTYKKICQ